VHLVAFIIEIYHVARSHGRPIYNIPLRLNWRSSLRQCATSRKVAGSVPYCVTGIIHWHNPSGRTLALRLNQPLKDINTRNISLLVKAAGA